MATHPKIESPSRNKRSKLLIKNYTSKIVGTRILSCGEGEQLGHPGRSQTRKPRAVDTFTEGTKFIQVCFLIRFSFNFRLLPEEFIHWY